MTKPTITRSAAEERIAAGYKPNAPPAKPPGPFRPVVELERLRTLRGTDPAAFAAAIGGKRVELALDERARQAAKHQGEDSNGDDAA